MVISTVNRINVKALQHEVLHVIIFNLIGTTILYTILSSLFIWYLKSNFLIYFYCPFFIIEIMVIGYISLHVSRITYNDIITHFNWIPDDLFDAIFKLLSSMAVSVVSAIKNPRKRRVLKRGGMGTILQRKLKFWKTVDFTLLLIYTVLMFRSLWNYSDAGGFGTGYADQNACTTDSLTPNGMFSPNGKFTANNPFVLNKNFVMCGLGISWAAPKTTDPKVTGYKYQNNQLVCDGPTTSPTSLYVSASLSNDGTGCPPEEAYSDPTRCSKTTVVQGKTTILQTGLSPGSRPVLYELPGGGFALGAPYKICYECLGYKAFYELGDANLANQFPGYEHCNSHYSVNPLCFFCPGQGWLRDEFPVRFDMDQIRFKLGVAFYSCLSILIWKVIVSLVFYAYLYERITQVKVVQKIPGKYYG